MKLISLLIGPFFLLSVACAIPRPTATAPMAIKSMDEEAKKFSSVTEKGVIYLFRDSHAAYYLWSPIIIDSKPITRTIAESYFRLEMSPGSHEIVSKADNEFHLTIEIEAGKVYFIREHPSFGWSLPRCSLKVVPENIGRKGVEKSRLLDLQATVDTMPAETHLFSK
jgi:hypothetical protein